MPKQNLHANFNIAVYGKSETKRTIDNIVGEVMRRYKFSSLTEFNAVLRQFNVMADRGKEGMIMFDKNGLIYSMLDTKGNKVGVPIKASALYCKPTMKNLEIHFHRGTSLKQPEKARLMKIVESFFHATDRHTRVNFCDYMNFYGINAMFRESKEGRVYGLTFIDNNKGAVFNGSELGKDYSGQALVKRFDNWVAGEKESQQRIDRGFEWSDLERYDYSKANCIQDIAQECLDLMKAEKYYPGTINPYLKTRKKRRRRMSL